MASFWNHQGENGRFPEGGIWIDRYGLYLDGLSSRPHTPGPDIRLCQSHTSPTHDEASAHLCPSDLTAFAGGAFSSETTPREPTEPLPGVVPAPQPPPSEKEGHFAPTDNGRYAESQTPGRVPKWVMADVFKRCAQKQGDLHVCIDPTHEKPHEFPTLRDLQKHLRIHTPYEHLPHHCFEDGCSRRFLFLNDLKRHRKVHAGPTDECPQCNKTLSRSDNLARHISSLHPNTPAAEVSEGLNESLGKGLMSPEVLSAAHDRKDSKSTRSKKPRMETPDDISEGEAMDEDSNIDPMLRAAQHPANDTTALFSFASASSHANTPSATGMPTSASSTEGNRRRLRRQETGGSSRYSEQSQSTESSRSSRKRKSRCTTLTGPSSVVSGSSEEKHVDEGSDGTAGRNPSFSADCNRWNMLANEEGQV